LLALELVWKITLSKSKDLPVLGRIAWGPGGQALVNKFILSIWFNHDSSYRKKKKNFLVFYSRNKTRTNDYKFYFQDSNIYYLNFSLFYDDIVFLAISNSSDHIRLLNTPSAITTTWY